MTAKIQPQIVDNVTAAELALDKLLSAIVAHDDERAREPIEPATALPLRFAVMDDAALTQIASDELVRDPIRHALREGVKRIGHELHRLGGLDAMDAAIQRVAEMAPRHSGRRMSIMDSARNGIGLAPPGGGAKPMAPSRKPQDASTITAALLALLTALRAFQRAPQPAAPTPLPFAVAAKSLRPSAAMEPYAPPMLPPWAPLQGRPMPGPPFSMQPGQQSLAGAIDA